jgi:uncharacterized membrane protein
MMGRIPLVSSIYRPVSQVVNMLQQEDQSEMRSMDVVYCSFGQAGGGGFLALLASSQEFQFAGQLCFACYTPPRPFPCPAASCLSRSTKLQTLICPSKT